jgi:hypothetical protein
MAELDLVTLATAVDACITVAEAEKDNSPEQLRYLTAGKKLATLVEEFLVAQKKENENGKEKPARKLYGVPRK